ncbi:MAG TPA: FAD-dependent oxidoreductase [Candidatus Limnocylindrales bacterium]|nr:FAD-dependent oxidoreductase [Candidatus Limnocylindrales bacterium]
MTKPKPQIVILGAGPAGLGAAFQLARHKKARVTVLEQRDRVGGNAGSFEVEGLYLDYGSHRLHPACNPAILQDLQQLLGNDLLLRPRHGRIRLKNRWIHFPLKPLDLLMKLPLRFALGVLTDASLKILPPSKEKSDRDETFASLLEGQLGKTICRDFYFPYARKIWGIAPEEISDVQARRRIAANSLGKMFKKVFSKLLGNSSPSTGREGNRPYFYYPRRGYGQISEALSRAAIREGAEIILTARVQEVYREGDRVKAVTYKDPLTRHTLQADYVWSTLPLNILIQSLQPRPEEEVILAAKKIRFRAMILIYLVLEQDRFSEFDAHYFPEPEIPITRISEPKNYNNAVEPVGLTALCAELPCETSQEVWGMKDEDLGRMVLEALSTAKIPVTAPIRQVFTRRIQHAYPIYQKGFERYFQLLDHYLEGIGGLLTFGRQGLFAHDNTHHALYMAYSAVDCLNEQGDFDQEKWRRYRNIFETHVVED